MALTVSFSVSESLANPSDVTFVDTSTGSDLTITSRRIYFKLANGNWLTESGESETQAYITWPYSNLTQTFTLLSQSTAAEIEVHWVAGSTVVYTDSNTFCFDLYDYVFALELLQGQTSSPNIIQDTTYFNNFMQLIVNLFNAENAITYGDDIYSSQGALNRNQNFIDNQTYYF